MDYLEHETLYRGEDALKKRNKALTLLCGAGALGSRLADLLARQGHNGLSIIDFDKVERDNFGTQDFGKQDIGRLKCDQVRLNIHKRIGVIVDSMTKRVTPDNVKSIIKGRDLVVDLFDNGESREILRAACESAGIPCLHAGLAAMGYFEVKWNEDYKAPPPVKDDVDAPCEYPMASNLVMLCVGATAEVINRFIDDGKRFNVEFWLKSFSLEINEAS